MTEFFCREGPNEFGPLSVVELRGLVASGRLTSAGQVRKGRIGKWLPATNVQGLFQPSRAAVAVAPAESDDDVPLLNGDDEFDEAPPANAFAQLEAVSVPPPLAMPAVPAEVRAATGRVTFLDLWAYAIAFGCYAAAAVAVLFGGFMFHEAKSVMHEIAGEVCFLGAIFAACGGCVIQILVSIRRKLLR